MTYYPASGAWSWWKFPNPTNQPNHELAGNRTGNFTACSLVYVLASGDYGIYGATFDPWGTSPNGPGWALLQNGSTATDCELDVGDGASKVRNNQTFALNGWHLCCGVYTAGASGTTITYVDGASAHSVAAANLGDLGNANKFTIGDSPLVDGANPFRDSLGGFWYWPVALSAVKIGQFWTAVHANGAGTTIPALAIGYQPSFVWLPGRPDFEWAFGVGGVGRQLKDSVPGPPYCGTSSSMTSGCLAAQVFDGTQYFDGGTTLGDPGVGDMTVCVVQAGSNLGTGYSASKAGTDKIGWGTCDTLSPGEDFDFVTYWGHAEQFNLGITGPEGLAYNDWVVGCGTLQNNRGDGLAQNCTYQNGVITPFGCDTTTTATLHSTGHLYIGATGWTYEHGALDWRDNWRGKIVGVWMWPKLLTAAQIASFSAPWIWDTSTTSPHCAIVNNAPECHSSGM
jgi:hypothetical protein